MRKRICIILAMMALMLPVAVEAKEFYAIVSNDGGTMNFFYDDLKLYRAGTCYYDRDEWQAAAETVTQVYFDKSLSSDTADCYRPKSTEYWFYEFKKLRYVFYLENLNTRDVTSMRSMFSGCESLQQLDVSKLYTGKVTNMKNMFLYCSSLTSLDVSHFDMRKVENAYQMFCNCSKLTTLDLSLWDLSSAVDIGSLFLNCSSLTTIYAEYGADWRNYKKIKTYDKMFKGCTKLVGGNGTQYNSSYTGIGQAVHDNNVHAGYFSAYDYPTIGGERITREGALNLSCIKSGVVTYSRMDGLTLSNATIKTDTDKGGISFTEGAYITLEGENSILCGRDGIHITGGDLFIEGSGSLNIKSASGYGISVSDMVEVSGSAELIIEGYHGALDGQKHFSTYYQEDRCGYFSNYGATLTLRSGGTRNPVIHDLSSMEGVDADWFFSYLGYEFSKEKNTVVDPYYEVPVTNEFKILPEEPESYNVYLGGHLINEANKDDFRPQSLSSGEVSYDPDTHTLYMKDAKFNRLYYPIDDNNALCTDGRKDFTLVLEGDNTLVGSNEDNYWHSICMGNWYESNKQADCHYTIRSADPDTPATLHFENGFYIDCNKARYVTVDIQNVNLYNDGKDLDFWGSSSDGGEVYLNITNSTIFFGLGSKGDYIYDFTDITLEDCHFDYDFYYDTNERVVKDRFGNKDTGPVRIIRDNNILLGDVNNDGNVDEYDVNDIVSHIQGNTPEGFNEQAADVNEDGVVDYKDALIIGEMAGVPVGISDASHLNENEKMRNGVDDGEHQSSEKRGEMYDLQGRRVEASNYKLQTSKLQKGIYIRNGKKVVVP